jgi:hypothetical protein
METVFSALQRPTLKDRTNFVTGRRAIRTRPATVDEKAASGLAVTTDAIAVLIKFCKRTCKAVIADRSLIEDITSAAYVIASAEGRPVEEALAAASFFPLLPAEDLTSLAHTVMEIRPACKGCTCAAGYAPLIVALAQAAARADGKPWTLSRLVGHLDQIKAAASRPLLTDTPRVSAIAGAIHQIIAAAGYAEPIQSLGDTHDR